jgi:hypothetical protein
MFEVTDDGLGQHSIAAQLNETKVDTWGAGKWKAAYWHPHTSASSSPTRRPSASSCHTKGDHVYLVCSAAHAKSGTCRYESVPYRRAVDAFMRSLRITIKSALRDNDTADMEAGIEQLQVELDAGETRVKRTLPSRQEQGCAASSAACRA